MLCYLNHAKFAYVNWIATIVCSQLHAQAFCAKTKATGTTYELKCKCN